MTENPSNQLYSDFIPTQMIPDKKKPTKKNKLTKPVTPISGTSTSITKKGGSGTAQAAAGAPFPNLYTFYSGRRIDVKLLEQTAHAPPIARSLWQLQLIAFPNFDFKLVPPSGQEEDEDTIKELLPKMQAIDHRINTTILCVQAMYDVMTYGSCIVELTWKEDDDGFIVPDVVHRLPAASFRQAAAGVAADRLRYVVGNILKGIVYDKTEQTYNFYQLQNNYGTTGIPIQIPTEQVIHIKDIASQYVDGEPYLQGIVSTITQLEFVRKRVMQTVSRIGSPKQVATVGIPPEYLKALEGTGGSQISVTSAIPGASSNTADIMLTDLWEYARQLVENQSADLAVAVPKGIELSWDQGHVAFNPTEIDSYLIKEAISHIFPRDMLEIQAAAISATSQPLLQLLKMMVQGWQNMCSRQFTERIWNEFLKLNGWEGWTCEFVWRDLIPQDEQVKQTLTIQRFVNHIVTLDEARESLGLPPLNDEERAVLMQELTLWKNPMAGQQQPGQQGNGVGGQKSMWGQDQSQVPEEQGPENYGEEPVDVSGIDMDMLNNAVEKPSKGVGTEF